jgi:hypothetical protein
MGVGSSWYRSPGLRDSRLTDIFPVWSVLHTKPMGKVSQKRSGNVAKECNA